jgi:hypothetical protein
MYAGNKIKGYRLQALRGVGVAFTLGIFSGVFGGPGI